MVGITIVQCDDRQKAEWNAYVATSSRASVYHRYEWRKVNATVLGHRSAYLAAMEGGRIVGVFPVVRLKTRLFGNIACSMPFVNYGGPCGDTDAIEQALLDAARELVDGWRVDYLEIRSRRPLPGLATSEHKVSMTIDLNSDPEVLWKAFTTAHRQDIRKGAKKGLTVKRGGSELLSDFYTVLSESWRDMGTPIFSIVYLDAVAAAFRDRIRVYVVYSGDEPAAGAFVLIDGDTVEGLWLGSRSKFRREYAGYVLYWDLIKDACELGFKKYHLGRSTVQSGGEQFKKKWNAHATQLYWQFILRNRTEVPQLNVQNPKYQLAIKMWQRLPLGVAEAIGPYISRNIP